MDLHFIVVTKMMKAGILEGVYFLTDPYGMIQVTTVTMMIIVAMMVLIQFIAMVQG